MTTLLCCETQREMFSEVTAGFNPFSADPFFRPGPIYHSGSSAPVHFIPSHYNHFFLADTLTFMQNVIVHSFINKLQRSLH